MNGGSDSICIDLSSAIWDGYRLAQPVTIHVSWKARREIVKFQSR